VSAIRAKGGVIDRTLLVLAPELGAPYWVPQADLPFPVGLGKADHDEGVLLVRTDRQVIHHPFREGPLVENPPALGVPDPGPRLFVPRVSAGGGYDPLAVGAKLGAVVAGRPVPQLAQPRELPPGRTQPGTLRVPSPRRHGGPIPLAEGRGKPGEGAGQVITLQ